jgi:hypothetical protein
MRVPIGQALREWPKAQSSRPLCLSDQELYSKQCEDAVTAIMVRHGRFQSWKRFNPIENLNTIIPHGFETSPP